MFTQINRYTTYKYKQYEIYKWTIKEVKQSYEELVYYCIVDGHESFNC